MPTPQLRMHGHITVPRMNPWAAIAIQRSLPQPQARPTAWPMICIHVLSVKHAACILPNKPLVLDMQITVVSSTPNAYAWLRVRSPHAVLLNSSGVRQIPLNRTCMHLINSNTESLNRRSHHAQQYYSQCLVFQMLSAMQLMMLQQNIVRKKDLLIMICQWTDWQLFPGSVIKSFHMQDYQ